MLADIGQIFTWMAAGVLFPLMLLPLAALVSGRLTGAVLWIVLVGAVAGASLLFAHLAVDISPPRLSIGFMVSAFGSLVVGTILIAMLGARAVAEKLETPLSAVTRRTGRIALYLVLAMALIQFTIVILRYVFGLNFIAMQESVTYLHGAVFLLAGGYALLTDDHVRVDILYRNAPPRRKALVDLVGTYLFLFPFCLVALWAAGPYVANSWAVREGSMEQSGIKGVYLLKTLIPIYFTLLIFAGFVNARRAVETLRSRSV